MPLPPIAKNVVRDRETAPDARSFIQRHSACTICTRCWRGVRGYEGAVRLDPRLDYFVRRKLLCTDDLEVDHRRVFSAAIVTTVGPRLLSPALPYRSDEPHVRYALGLERN